MNYEEPPPEAYTRVTNPERFRPVQARALELLEQLERDFAVERTQGYGVKPELEGELELIYPTAILKPLNPKAASVAAAFSNFPGIITSFGLGYKDSFPVCGCDACAETPEEEIMRLEELLESIVSGRFREEITLFPGGGAQQRWEFRFANGASSRAHNLEAPRALQLLKEHGQLIEWEPWTKR